MTKEYPICTKKQELLSIEEENVLLKSALYEVYARLTYDSPDVTPTYKVYGAIKALQYVRRFMPTKEQHESNLKLTYGEQR